MTRSRTIRSIRADTRRQIVRIVGGRLVRRGPIFRPKFTARRLAMKTTTTDLAYRRDNGIEVVLLWDRLGGRLTVSIADLASGDAFDMAVAPDQALDAVHHPYAHAQVPAL
jgi:hypothetical protein